VAVLLCVVSRELVVCVPLSGCAPPPLWEPLADDAVPLAGVAELPVAAHELSAI
jgi:hypothetical protein